MPTFDFHWLLLISIGLMIVGDIGAASYYWFHCEYKLMGMFLCYAVASSFFLFITGVK